MAFRTVPHARSLGRKPAAAHSLVSRETLRVDGLQVTVLRKKNRNMYLRVKPPYGAIEVTAPVAMPARTIEEFVRERRPWLDDALAKMAVARSRTFVGGVGDPTGADTAEATLRATSALGGSDVEHAGHVALDGGDDFTWTPGAVAQARASIDRRLPALLRKWEPVVGRGPSKVTVRTMTSRWGSCTPKTGRIRLNLQLGLMDPKFLEYVLVHEMTHLWEGGHGAAFQARMTDALPNWKQLRASSTSARSWRCRRRSSGRRRARPRGARPANDGDDDDVDDARRVRLVENLFRICRFGHCRRRARLGTIGLFVYLPTTEDDVRTSLMQMRTTQQTTDGREGMGRGVRRALRALAVGLGAVCVVLLVLTLFGGVAMPPLAVYGCLVLSIGVGVLAEGRRGKSRRRLDV
ncbi:MAG: SprT family zinc-dependent metalloprotease [Bifidobacterium sp.]|nr:SprT family zinc-dependent metalloprotease [Bifidobacterium sp.]